MFLLFRNYWNLMLLLIEWGAVVFYEESGFFSLAWHCPSCCWHGCQPRPEIWIGNLPFSIVFHEILMQNKIQENENIDLIVLVFCIVLWGEFLSLSNISGKKRSKLYNFLAYHSKLIHFNLFSITVSSFYSQRTF